MYQWSPLPLSATAGDNDHSVVGFRKNSFTTALVMDILSGFGLVSG